MKVFIFAVLFVSVAITVAHRPTHTESHRDGHKSSCTTTAAPSCYPLSDLTPFCPPCPPGCAGFELCGCAFPDANSTIIYPNVINIEDRPTFCSKCLEFECLIRVVCPNPATPCTAETIASYITTPV